MKYEEIVRNQEIRAYYERGNEILDTLGYTDHSTVHTCLVAEKAAEILDAFGYDQELQELAKIAGFMHDIGNAINRHHHAEYGALLANEILKETDMSISDRVRAKDRMYFDIHDRVNYAVTQTTLRCEPEEKKITLELTVDEDICTMYEYFDIFLDRMTMCSHAARILDAKFSLRVNGQKVL